VALEEGTDNLMRWVTDVDTNIDIGQGLHVGSVAKEKDLVLDREVEIEGDEEELAPKFLNFIFLLYYLNFFLFFIIFLLFFYYFFFLFYYYFFFILLFFFFIDFFYFFFVIIE
jgi:positive regulator of sigma E activity